MAKFDTVAEVRRLCKLVASEEDDRQHFYQRLNDIVATHGPIDQNKRDYGNVFIYSNEAETHAIINFHGQQSLYQLRNL